MYVYTYIYALINKPRRLRQQGEKQSHMKIRKLRRSTWYYNMHKGRTPSKAK